MQTKKPSCCCGPSEFACSCTYNGCPSNSCLIPQKNLTVSWTGTLTNGSQTMTFSPPDLWQGPCFNQPGSSQDWQWLFACGTAGGTSGPIFELVGYVGSTCPTGGVLSDCFNPSGSFTVSNLVCGSGFTMTVVPTAPLNSACNIISATLTA